MPQADFVYQPANDAAGGIVLFITSNLALGYLISTLVRSQLQAMQVSIFYIMPSIFLSGFVFPFRGLPGWAQAIGEMLPITHFLRIIRGALLKGQVLGDMVPELLALGAFLTIAASVTVARSRTTLD